MKTIFFIHWNEEELREKIIPLQKAGYTVNYHFSTQTTADFKHKLPDMLIICLDRLPSHGKAYAEWLWEAKKRQHIPILFCGGGKEKVDPLKLKFPKAVFCSNEQLVETIKNIK